jgi:hypothetical protein
MRKNHQMKDHLNAENRDAVSGWEDERGALQSEATRRIDNARPPRDRRRPTQKRLDESHLSDIRGEHRYDDVHQTEAEQEARQERDELKQRLARLPPRRVP